jgi:hypothetical protein
MLALKKFLFAVSLLPLVDQQTSSRDVALKTRACKQMQALI